MQYQHHKKHPQGNPPIHSFIHSTIFVGHLLCTRHIRFTGEQTKLFPAFTELKVYHGETDYENKVLYIKWKRNRNIQPTKEELGFMVGQGQVAV